MDRHWESGGDTEGIRPHPASPPRSVLETKAIIGSIVLGNRPLFTPTIAHLGIHLCTGLIEIVYVCD